MSERSYHGATSRFRNSLKDRSNVGLALLYMFNVRRGNIRDIVGQLGYRRLPNVNEV